MSEVMVVAGADERSGDSVGAAAASHGDLSVGPARPSVSVVIPAFNEAESIEWVLEQIPSWVSEVVLVEGRSTDLTEVIARMLRSDLVVVQEHTPGKGAALRAGFAAARGDIVVMLDADGSTDPRELDTFVEALESGADFVKGSRTLAGGGSIDFTLLRRAGNSFFVWLVHLLFGERFTDLLYGYCAFWRRHLGALAVTSEGFEIETELVLSAVKAGLEIREVPSIELPRRGGRSKLHTFRDGWRVLGQIVRQRLQRTSEPVHGGIELVALELPSAQPQPWPAADERRQHDRRVLDRIASGYRGPDRRVSERRMRPDRTTTVYLAVHRQDTETQDDTQAGEPSL